MSAMTASEARASVAAIEWSQVPGDPDDVRVLREALEYLVSEARDDMGAEEAFGELLDVGDYVLEINDEGSAMLVGQFLDLATCAELFDEPERWVWFAATALDRSGDRTDGGPLARVIEERRERLEWLWSHGPEQAQAAVAVLAALARLEGWRDRLRRRALDPGSARLRATLVLASIELGGQNLEALGRTLAQQSGGDWRLERAAAACLRLAAHEDPTLRERLPAELVDHADRHGHPGWLEKLYQDAYPLRLPAALALAEPLTTGDHFEPAVVLFAGDSMVLVKHETRGNFTLRIAETGLTKGDPVELAGFVPSPHATVRKVRFQGPRGPVELEL